MKYMKTEYTHYLYRTLYVGNFEIILSTFKGRPLEKRLFEVSIRKRKLKDEE